MSILNYKGFKISINDNPHSNKWIATVEFIEFEPDYVNLNDYAETEEKVFEKVKFNIDCYLEEVPGKPKKSKSVDLIVRNKKINFREIEIDRMTMVFEEKLEENGIKDNKLLDAFTEFLLFTNDENFDKVLASIHETLE